MTGKRPGNHPSGRLWSQATPASSPVGTHRFPERYLTRCLPELAEEVRFNLQGALIATWKWAPSLPALPLEAPTPEAPDTTQPDPGRVESGASGFRTHNRPVFVRPLPHNISISLKRHTQSWLNKQKTKLFTHKIRIQINLKKKIIIIKPLGSGGIGWEPCATWAEGTGHHDPNLATLQTWLTWNLCPEPSTTRETCKAHRK